MRSMKRPRKPVRRYRSLLSPGIALLALFAFWYAFVPGERGETAWFEQDGLCLEITRVHHMESTLAEFDPDLFEPHDTFYAYPGAQITVLAAPPMGDGGARWELRDTGDGTSGPLGLAEGMDPLVFPEEGRFCVYDLEQELAVMAFAVTESGE